MNKKPLLLLLVVLIVTITGIVVMFSASESIHDHAGPFERRVISDALHLGGVKAINLDGYEIIGHSDDNIFLWSRNEPFHLLELDEQLSAVTNRRMIIGDVDTIRFFNIEARIDSPYFYLADGTVPYIYRGRIGEWQGKRFMYDSTYFLDIAPITETSFALRSMMRDLDGCALLKQSKTKPHVFVNPALLEKQVDGCFCTDGMLNMDRSGNKIIYVYSYRNQYMVIDTVLNLIRKGHTIDTFNTARIKIAAIKSNGNTSFRLASPAFAINKRSYAARDLLFVNSTVRAKNESRQAFKKATVIDVYDTNETVYKFSFYIPMHDNEQMREFIVVDHHLFALYPNAIVRFTLKINSFQKIIKGFHR